MVADIPALYPPEGEHAVFTNLVSRRVRASPAERALTGAGGTLRPAERPLIRAGGPLGSPERALRTLRRARALGARGILRRTLRTGLAVRERRQRRGDLARLFARASLLPQLPELRVVVRGPGVRVASGP